MNWGHYITIAFILFGAFIMYMVIRAFQMDFDLVAEDYYAQEIAYQDKITQKSNFEELGVEIKISQKPEGIKVVFPPVIKKPIGEIYFYHPSRKIFDKKFVIDLDKDGVQMIDRNELVGGKYHIKLTWKEEEREYFFQKILFVK